MNLAMRFQKLRLQDFRNIPFLELDLQQDRIFFLGANGQGKSNLLEALGMVSALRSFRTQALDCLPRKGHAQFNLFAEVEHEHFGATRLIIRGAKKGRYVQVDEQKVTKMADFIGRFPVVIMSSDDLNLLRGAPSERRRCFDLIFSAGNSEYYSVLQGYHKAVANRNRLLKQHAEGAVLDAFELEIAPLAIKLKALRTAALSLMAEKLVAAYIKIAGVDEIPNLIYQANCGETQTVEAYLELLQMSRQRDFIMGSTSRGPHRDDFKFQLAAHNAREFASDGQQRALCVALRMAQCDYYQKVMGYQPVLLADDVLGELDRERRKNFWAACPDRLQLIATGTELPDVKEGWSVYSVVAGAFQKN
jgi:DNA replication and repair protein RecF